MTDGSVIYSTGLNCLQMEPSVGFKGVKLLKHRVSPVSLCGDVVFGCYGEVNCSTYTFRMSSCPHTGTLTVLVDSLKWMQLQAGHFLQCVALSRLLSLGSGQQVLTSLPAPPLHTP